MIITADLVEFIDTHKNQIYKYIEYDIIKDSSLIKGEIYGKLVNKYELEDNLLDISSKYYIETFIDSYFTKIVADYNERKRNRSNIANKLQFLKTLKLPEQRSQEWYDMRDKMLTASSLADSLGKGHFRTRGSLLIDKTSTEPPPYFTSPIIEWGVKYEPVATTFYEKLNNLSILEFGLVPHSKLKIFGASPDGICDIDSPEDYVGRMLEIKCPPVRKFTKEVPEHYWMQMQGQLECCDLEECDFLQVKLLEYNTEEEYIDDKLTEDSELKEGLTVNNLPKGLVLSFSKRVNDKTEYHYEYSEFYSSYDKLKEWSQKIIDGYPLEYDKLEFHWWKIERYECTLVHRDRKWWLDTVPEILNFWEDVEHYRKIGNQELLDQRDAKKKKRKGTKKASTKHIITINQDIMKQVENNYLLGSDSD